MQDEKRLEEVQIKQISEQRIVISFFSSQVAFTCQECVYVCVCACVQP